MAAKTQDLSKFISAAQNLYEAALVIAKRSRQINEDLYQKKRDQQIMEELEGGMEDEYLQSQPEELEDEEIIIEENPIVTAQGEFLEGKLEYYYEPVRR